MKLAPLQVRYGDLLMGPGTPYAVDWDASGLLSLPPIRSSDTPRARGHGAWAGEDWADGQTLPLVVGMRRGRTQIPVDVAANTLANYCIPKVARDLWFQGKFMSEPRCLVDVTVKRLDLRPASIRDAVTRADVELYAADPIRYTDEHIQDVYAGPRPTTVGVNLGTAAAWPRFRVYGPLAAQKVTLTHVESGRRISFTTTLTPAQSLVIDQEHGTAVVGAEDRNTALADRQWWAAAPGTPFTVTVDGPVGLRVDVMWRPAWW